MDAVVRLKIWPIFLKDYNEQYLELVYWTDALWDLLTYICKI